MNEENRLFLTGREKDLIIRSGHNIDPASIEEIADAHPAVTLSAAVGMPDEYAGEVPILFVVKAPGKDLDPEDFENYMTGHITEPPAKPKKIIEIAEMPTTTVGKIFKPALREQGVKEKTRQILSKYIDQETIADIRTKTLKDGNTNVTVAINSGKTEKSKPEIEAEIIYEFIDLPINLTIRWN
jgi:fatty-acyl-CoA synthase